MDIVALSNGLYGSISVDWVAPPPWNIQDVNDDIKEITIYSNGEYVSFFTTSPGGVKQNYKTNIDIAELIEK